MCKCAPPRQKLPNKHTRSGTWQGCHIPSMCKSAPPRQKLPNKNARSGTWQKLPHSKHVQNCTTLAEVAIQTSKKWEMAGAATFQACAEVHHPGRSCQTNTQELGWKQLSANWGKPAIALRGLPLMSLPQSSLFSVGQVSPVVLFLAEVLAFQKKKLSSSYRRFGRRPLA